MSAFGIIAFYYGVESGNQPEQIRGSLLVRSVCRSDQHIVVRQRRDRALAELSYLQKHET